MDDVRDYLEAELSKLSYDFWASIHEDNGLMALGITYKEHTFQIEICALDEIEPMEFSLFIDTGIRKNKRSSTYAFKIEKDGHWTFR